MSPICRVRSLHRAVLLAALLPGVGFAQAGDSVMAERHHVRGRALMVADRFDSASVEYAAAARIREALGDSAGAASSLNSLGSAHYQVGQYEFALDAFLRSLEIRRAIRDSVGVARVLTNMGKTYQDWRQYERSLRTLEEAVAIAEALDDPQILGYALNTLALVKSDVGDQAAARDLIARSLLLYGSQNPPATSADSASSGWFLNMIALGIVEVREGHADSAATLLNRALDVAVRAGSPRAEARSRLYLGQAYRAAGDAGRARREFERTLVVARGTKQRVLALEAHRELAMLAERRGDHAAALRDLRAFQALNDTIFDQSVAQRLAVMESRTETERQQRENAELVAERREQAVLISRQRTVGVLGGLVLALGGVLVLQLLRFNRRGREREALLATANTDLARTNLDLERVNGELRAALAEVRTLKGFIPICAHCKSVRDDRGFWEAVETYVSSRSEAMFSHSVCPSCGPQHYGDEWPSAPDPEDAPVR